MYNSGKIKLRKWKYKTLDKLVKKSTTKNLAKLKQLIKTKHMKGEDCMMTAVLDLQEIKNSREFNPSLQIPFLDMILDKEKRQAIFEQYDKNYEESEDEMEIFKEMTTRRLKRGK